MKKSFIPVEINVIKIEAANIIADSGGASLSCPANGLCTTDGCSTFCSTDDSCIAD